MDAKVKIVTDSTSDIPAGLAAELDVSVVPLNVRFGDREYRDRVDLDSNQFFHMLESNSRPPATSLPPPGAFVAVYEEQLAENRPVVSIHISSRLSGTYQSACTAALNFPGKDIAAIDSGLVASALTLVVVRAARAARGGAGFEAISRSVREDCARAAMYFALETMDYLARGGRVGKAGHLIGSMLNIKPILTVRDGVIEAAAKVRTKKKALEKIIELITARPSEPQIAAVSHARCPGDAAAAAELLRAAFPSLEIIFSEIGPVIGAHSGPGCVEISVI